MHCEVFLVVICEYPVSFFYIAAVLQKDFLRKNPDAELRK